MSILGFAPGKPVLNPRGSWEGTAQRRMGTPSRASSMLNSRISNGIVASRAGLAAVAAASGKVTALYNWIAPNGSNYVLYQDGLIVKSLLQGGATSSLFTAPGTTRATSFSDINVWNYFCGYDTSSAGTFQTQIYDGANVDTAFRAAPTLTVATAVDGGTGLCTAGLHYIGFVYQNRNGFSTKPSTTVAAAPIAVTLNAGLRQINVSVTLPALTDGGANAGGTVQATLFLLMTRADNPALWYFVPAVATTSSVVSQPVPYNAITTLSFVASISDEDLAASAVPANGPTANPNQFLLLTQDGAGNGPFLPSFVVPYGTRLCYGAGTVLYVSGQNRPQELTGDQNIVTLTNQRRMGMAFPLPGSNNLYITGQDFTAYVTDNSDVPATWAQPVVISPILGSPFPGNVCFRTGGNYVWMATERGLELFNGQFQQKPLTFLVSGLDASNNPIGWNRVNWKAAYAVQVADDVTNQKCYVAVPLDGATEPNFQFVIDYQNSPDGGINFENIDIGLDQYNPATFSAIGVVKELATARTNLWIGPSAAGSILHFDSSVPCEVDSYWKSGLVRGVNEFVTSMIRVGALDIWARGSTGAPGVIVVAGPDDVVTVTPQLQSIVGTLATLSPKPGITYIAKLDLNFINNYTVRFGTTAGNNYELSGFMAYAKKSLANR